MTGLKAALVLVGALVLQDAVVSQLGVFGAHGDLMILVPITAALTARGLPATFIADLQAKITAFDAASGNKNDGKADQVGSTAALAAAGADGLKAVQELRTIMRLELRTDPGLPAAWKRAARVEKPAAR